MCHQSCVYVYEHIVHTEALLHAINHFILLFMTLLLSLPHFCHVQRYVVRKEANRSVSAKGNLSHAMVLMDFMCQCAECLNKIIASYGVWFHRHCMIFIPQKSIQLYKRWYFTCSKMSS